MVLMLLLMIMALGIMSSTKEQRAEMDARFKPWGKRAAIATVALWALLLLGLVPP